MILSKKNSCKNDGCERNKDIIMKTSIGGQALMEGIMMRGPKKTAMAVRNAKGEIIIEEEETKTLKTFWRKVPLVRGVVNFVFSMAVGYKCLMRSAEIAVEDGLSEIENEKKESESTLSENTEAKPSIELPEDTLTDNDKGEKTETKDDTKGHMTNSDSGTSGLMTGVAIVSIILALALSLFLFKFLPTLLYRLLITIGMPEPANRAAQSFMQSGIEGLFKLIIIVGYMSAMSLMKDIKRTFMYHGAEHKSIFCYEKGLELTVENVRRQTRFHPRCGTSFLILMIIISIFVGFFINPIGIAIWGDVPGTALRMLIGVLLLPINMGIGYEVIKFAGRHDNIITKIVSAPGLWLQRLTVKEPDDSMIECAIVALKKVIPDDDSDKI